MNKQSDCQSKWTMYQFSLISACIDELLMTYLRFQAQLEVYTVSRQPCFIPQFMAQV